MAAKEKKTTRTEKKSKETFLTGFSLDKIIPIKYQTLSFLLVILLIFLLFYSPIYFGGKTFQSGDIITSRKRKTYLKIMRAGLHLESIHIYWDACLRNCNRL